MESIFHFRQQPERRQKYKSFKISSTYSPFWRHKNDFNTGEGGAGTENYSNFEYAENSPSQDHSLGPSMLGRVFNQF